MIVNILRINNNANHKTELAEQKREQSKDYFTIKFAQLTSGMQRKIEFTWWVSLEVISSEVLIQLTRSQH